MEITMIHDETIIEVSGTDGERFLLDFMANGSTVAQLMFDIGIVRVMEARNAAEYTMRLVKRDVEEQAQIVRTKVYKHAFKALAANRKKTAWDRSIAQSLNEETI